MLRTLILTNALFAVVSFMPKVAFGLPSVGNINNSPTASLAQNSYPSTVIVGPGNSYPTGTVYPNSYPNTVIVGPGNSYPTGTIYPNSYPGAVIVKPNRVNPPSEQSSCGGIIFGSPIPSPVPVNPYTGGFCR